MESITKLMITMSHPERSDEAKLKQACLSASDSIAGANRISIWRLKDNNQIAECLMCYDQITQEFTSGQILLQVDFPEYFEAILANDHIIAPDARSHPSTQCFNELYFIPHDIHSLLDYILHKDFLPTGLICCESVGAKADWQPENLTSLRKISNVISMFFTP
jgi:hypothetical protein